MAFIFPTHIFNPKQVNARPVPRVISGGEALSGDEDVIATDGGGRWMIDYSGINLHTAEQQRAWSAWQGYLAGGVVECLVPILSLATAPRPYVGPKPMRVSGLVADDPLFPESVAFASPHVIATIGANAALRATSLVINVAQGAAIQGGEKFSVGGRGVRIIRQTGEDTYQVEPPLREAVTSGASANFDWPVVLCRMAVGGDFEGALSMGRFGEKSISFVERT